MPARNAGVNGKRAELTRNFVENCKERVVTRTRPVAPAADEERTDIRAVGQITAEVPEVERWKDVTSNDWKEVAPELDAAVDAEWRWRLTRVDGGNLALARF
jgi:hypothetical protein